MPRKYHKYEAQPVRGTKYRDEEQTMTRETPNIKNRRTKKEQGLDPLVVWYFAEKFVLSRNVHKYENQCNENEIATKMSKQESILTKQFTEKKYLPIFLHVSVTVVSKQI